MITANITVDVQCDTPEESDLARAKLEDAGFEIVLIVDATTFKSTMQQVISAQEV